MSEAVRFLVVEDNEDGGELIEHALTRQFPAATVRTFRDGDAAVAALANEAWNVVVVHRSLDADGVDVVSRLRALNAQVPIVMISGRDQSGPAAAAGASEFVPYSDWQQLGNVVAQLRAGG